MLLLVIFSCVLHIFVPLAWITDAAWCIFWSLSSLSVSFAEDFKNWSFTPSVYKRPAVIVEAWSVCVSACHDIQETFTKTF